MGDIIKDYGRDFIRQKISGAVEQMKAMNSANVSGVADQAQQDVYNQQAANIQGIAGQQAANTQGYSQQTQATPMSSAVDELKKKNKQNIDKAKSIVGPNPQEITDPKQKEELLKQFDAAREKAWQKKLEEQRRRKLQQQGKA